MAFEPSWQLIPNFLCPSRWWGLAVNGVAGYYGTSKPFLLTLQVVVSALEGGVSAWDLSDDVGVWLTANQQASLLLSAKWPDIDVNIKYKNEEFPRFLLWMSQCFEWQLLLYLKEEEREQEMQIKALGSSKKTH